MDQGVISLLDVDLALPLIGGHCASLHGHFTGPELDQVLAGGSTGAGHQAGEQGSGGHGDDWGDMGDKQGDVRHFTGIKASGDGLLTCI